MRALNLLLIILIVVAYVNAHFVPLKGDWKHNPFRAYRIKTRSSIRRKKISTSKSIGYLRKGHIIFASFESQYWAKFYKGYVNTSSLEEITGISGYIATSDIIGRTGPSTSYSAFANIMKGTDLIYYAEDPTNSNWCITNAGYIEKKYVSANTSANTVVANTVANTSSNTVVNTSSNTVVNASANTVAANTVANTSSNTVVNESANKVVADTVADTSANKVVANTVADTSANKVATNTVADTSANKVVADTVADTSANKVVADTVADTSANKVATNTVAANTVVDPSANVVAANTVPANTVVANTAADSTANNSAFKTTQILSNKQNYGQQRNPSDIKYIVIHPASSIDQSTSSYGYSAKYSAKYYQQSNVKYSFHYFVDGSHVINSVPDNYVAWPVSAGQWESSSISNSNTLNIVLCNEQSSAASVSSTMDMTVKVVTEMMRKYNIKWENVILASEYSRSVTKKTWMKRIEWIKFKQRIQRRRHRYYY